MKILETVRPWFGLLGLSQQLEYRDGGHPTRVRLWASETFMLDADSSHYIYVQTGQLALSYDSVDIQMRRGYFGAFPGQMQVSGCGSALIVTRQKIDESALFGGPIAERGRLRYVDGCTTTVLLSPAVRGEPCLNFMHLPPKVIQTTHTHPSLRVGVVVSGDGRCGTGDGEFDMSAGTAFVIPPDAAHSFRSGESDLRVVIYHPDSDSGPTHTDHTMLNRTFVDGISAASLPNLQTKEVA